MQAELRRAGVNPVRRKVYFYDTPELALFAKDLVLRARVTDGDDDDSTVKLRPLPLPDIPARWSATDGVRIELDVVGNKQVPSAKLDGEPDRGEIEQVEHGALELSKLFTKAQEAIVADELPSGTSLNDLAVLGPVDARKWELPPETFPHKLSVEEWSLPDGTHFVELSFKVVPDEARAPRGVPRAARSPEDRSRRRPRPEDPRAQVLRRATALEPLGRPRRQRPPGRCPGGRPRSGCRDGSVDALAIKRARNGAVTLSTGDPKKGPPAAGVLRLAPCRRPRQQRACGWPS